VYLGVTSQLITACSFSTPSPERQQQRRGEDKARSPARSGNTISSETGRADLSVTPRRDDTKRGRATPGIVSGLPSQAYGAETSHSRTRSPGKQSAEPSYKHSRKVDLHLVGNDASSTIAERRRGTRPSPIDIALATKSGSAAPRQLVGRAGTSQAETRFGEGASLPAARAKYNGVPTIDGDAVDGVPSSLYSDSKGTMTSLAGSSPLGIQNSESELAVQGLDVLQGYADWVRALGDPAGPSSTRCEVGSGSEPADVASENEAGRPLGSREVFSPLTPYAQGSDGPSARKGRKVMVGYNGWLERTNKPAEDQTSASPPKKAGLLSAFRKVARDVVSRAAHARCALYCSSRAANRRTQADMADIRAARRAREEERSRRTTPLRISLDPREQSLLYCELEFILTSAVDSYVNSQLNAGRLDADKYKKITDGWLDKGRPRVVGFRYDLETQLDLVRLHVSQFRFYGSRAGNPAAIAGVLDMMRVDARAMRIRTFCQPDSVVAKQLLDAQHLLNTLGCSEPQQIQLAEVIQFFKTVVEREKAFRARLAAPDLPASSTHPEVQGAAPRKSTDVAVDEQLS